MRSKLTRILMLAAWLLATGSQWDVVQTFAWARMLAHNARVLPWPDALELTFSSEGRCTVCLVVQENRPTAAGDEAAVVSLLAKEPLVFQAATQVIVDPPVVNVWMPREVLCSTYARPAPPTPPPRELG